MPKASYKRKDDALYESVLKLKNLDECKRFFADICSPTELSAIEQRFEIARMLYDGFTYRDIADATGASSATISRTNRFLQESGVGFKTAYGRCSKKKNAQADGPK